jgi:hypothetical protein
VFSNVCSSVPEELEDTKGVIRIRKLKKDTQHNDQKKKDKRTNNNLQSTTKHRVTRTLLKPGSSTKLSEVNVKDTFTSHYMKIHRL